MLIWCRVWYEFKKSQTNTTRFKYKGTVYYMHTNFNVGYFYFFTKFIILTKFIFFVYFVPILHT